MTGTVSQLITLTSFANEFLSAGSLPPGFKENLSFQFCNKVDFRIFERPFFLMKKREKILADSPGEWFIFLQENGCVKLRLFFVSSADQSLAKDYKLAGLIGGGGNWFIEAVYQDHSDAWANRWEVTQKDDRNDNIWTVNYARTLSNLLTMNQQIPLQKCKEDLAETLEKIEAFAISKNLDYWSAQFTQALQVIKSDIPETFYYNSALIVNKNYSLQARQVLYAAATAWVFGAMGSWNDLGFDTKQDNEKYETLTETLYARVNSALIAAINSY